MGLTKMLTTITITRYPTQRKPRGKCHAYRARVAGLWVVMNAPTIAATKARIREWARTRGIGYQIVREWESAACAARQA